MIHSTTPSSAPAAAPDAEDDTAPTTALVAQEEETALDAHGFDPAAHDWIPVRRQPHPGGWSAEKQRVFIAALADTGSVTQAARDVGMSTRSAYALRRLPEGAGFARAWTAAIHQGMNRLVDVCMERALEGTEEAIFDKDGRVIGHRRRYHDRMAMFLLRAHLPEQYRDAHRADRARGEALPPAIEPVAEAVKAIDPVPPPAPHTLMAPDDLATALQVADMMPGKMPRWHRDRELVARDDCERDFASGVDPAISPLGEQFERDLEAAKNGTWVPPGGAPGGKRRRRR